MTARRAPSADTAKGLPVSWRRYLLLAPFVVVLLGVLAIVVELGDTVAKSEQFKSTDIIWLFTYAVAAGTGAVILNYVPGHLVGRCLLAYGLMGALAFSGFGLAVAFAEAGSQSVAAVAEGVSAAIITAGFLLLPGSLLMFPTGALPSPRWRVVVWLMAITALGGTFAALVIGDFGGDTSTGTSFGPGPLDERFGDLAAAISDAFFLALMVCLVAIALSLVIRYRRSVGDERLQIKWVATAGAFLTVGALLNGPGEVTGIGEVIVVVGLASVPLSMAVAIIKYHLFDIDVVIKRSITFGVLVVFIGVMYVAIVVGIGELLGDRSSLGLSVLATAVVAIAFQPVRSRVERLANRLVYGKRATPYEVLARFSRRGSEESDEDVLVRIPRLIVDGTGASNATVWVKADNGFRAAASWPIAESSRGLDASREFLDPEAEVSLPVFHDDELLGGISLVAARGVAITPPELELVESLASGLGLTLRNAELTGALRQQVKDLRRSRDRIVSASDEARRSLEHDLDSGPQQHLVAVKVKLAPVRRLAEDAGAARTAGVLADVEIQAGDAIQAVRNFAAGVYPPLLSAEGLSVALGQETRRAAIPVDLNADGVGRYPRDVEAAVYFSILEALQNTAKYAEADSAAVRLSETNGDLRFDVRDDGNGFDPGTVRRGAGLNGIGDRIDTVGGTWTISSTPDEGTTVSGSVPVKDRVSV
jgi:signal transduction histidine kinase